MFNKLESIPLFKGVDQDTLQLLVPLFESYSCPSETVIFEQDGRAEYLYLILEGSVEMRFKPYDGPEITIITLNKGGIFGWSAVVGNPTYTSGAISKDGLYAIRMHGEDLRAFCTKEPEAGYIILDLLARSVSKRWHNARSQIQSLLNSKVIVKDK